jgi:hypothetical protein
LIDFGVFFLFGSLTMCLTSLCTSKGILGYTATFEVYMTDFTSYVRSFLFFEMIFANYRAAKRGLPI